MKTPPAHDDFITLRHSARNIDRWIVRSSILLQLRQRYSLFTGRLLDVGCGRMPYRADIMTSTTVSEYVGLDLDSALVYDTAVKPDATWDGKVIPFPECSFDCAIATEVFEHAPDLQRLLVEIRRVVRPGGIVFFTTPFIWPYHETPHDMQRWTGYGLASQLQNAGFNEISAYSIGNWHSSFAQFLGLWVARAPMPRLLRAAIRHPVLWMQRFLMRFDADSPASENSMPRMIAGTARA